MTIKALEHAALCVLRDHVVVRDGVPTLPLHAGYLAVRRIVRLCQQDAHKVGAREVEWTTPALDASLRGDLVEAGIGDWRGALGADERPIHVGMRGSLAEGVTIAGDYLPVRLETGTPITVDSIFFGGVEWCSIVLDKPHPTGLKRARVMCNVVVA